VALLTACLPTRTTASLLVSSSSDDQSIGVSWELDGALPLTPAYCTHLAEAARVAVAAVVSHWPPQRSPSTLLAAPPQGAHLTLTLPRLLAALAVHHLPSPGVPSFLLPRAAVDARLFRALRRSLAAMLLRRADEGEAAAAAATVPTPNAALMEALVASCTTSLDDCAEQRHPWPAGTFRVGHTPDPHPGPNPNANANPDPNPNPNPRRGKGAVSSQFTYPEP